MLKGGLYVAMGDSWTWAVHPDETLGTQFYPTMIRNQIRKDYGQCRLINKGIGGAASNLMIPNLNWLTDLEPDLITIGVGMNDCANDQIGTANFITNMTTVLNAIQLKSPHALIILCTAGRTTDPTRTPYVQSYRDAMVTVATNFNLPVCHFENAWTNDSTNMESDGIHPNPAGQQAVFNLLYPQVQTVSSNWLSTLQK